MATPSLEAIICVALGSEPNAQGNWMPVLAPGKTGLALSISTAMARVGQLGPSPTNGGAQRLGRPAPKQTIPCFSPRVGAVLSSALGPTVPSPSFPCFSCFWQAQNGTTTPILWSQTEMEHHNTLKATAKKKRSREGQERGTGFVQKLTSTWLRMAPASDVVYALQGSK